MVFSSHQSLLLVTSAVKSAVMLRWQFWFLGSLAPFFFFPLAKNGAGVYSEGSSASLKFVFQRVQSV